MLWMAVCLIVSFTGCTSEEMDYNNPDAVSYTHLTLPTIA